MMKNQRFDTNWTRSTAVVTLIPPESDSPPIGRFLRDELVAFAKEERPRQLIVDFGDLHCWHADLLGAVAHVKSHLPVPGEIHCCGLSLRLTVACQFLSLAPTIFSIHENVQEALEHCRPSWSTPTRLPVEVLLEELLGAA